MGSKPRVLMFGWEFPPVISGGLGVACLGLCKALAPHTHLKMVIPKSAPGFSIPEIELVGLNSFSREQLSELFARYKYTESNASTHIPAGLLPYAQIPDDEYVSEKFYQVYHSEVEPFEIDSLYAGDVIKKVIEFSRISVRYGMQQSFDIIHAHDWMTFLPAMELKTRTGKPLVIHVHSLEYDRAGEHSKNWVWDLERRAMEMADYIMPVSAYTGRICYEHYGADARKILPVHNGVETVKCTVKNNPHKQKLVIFFGRITMQKGPEYFVEAARIIAARNPDVKFVMAGSGDLQHPLMERVAAYGLGNRFHFTGFLNKQKLNELLAMADIYCMPSVSEPFGLSAVEAVQYGIPVIMSKTSGAGEVLSGALKLDFWDVEKLASDIEATLYDESLRNRIVEQCAQDLEEISWEKTARKVLKVYRNLLSHEAEFENKISDETHSHLSLTKIAS